MEKNIYSRAKISARALEVFIFFGLLSILLVTVYLSVTGGFNVYFDTRGGSEVASQRLRYGERLCEPLVPTREGYVFLGWYADEGLTQRVEPTQMTVTESTTVYAAWGKSE